ncbi:alpha/beta hydrolase [Bacillus sp. ISL-47]|uniref:alpha/beta hydrolase n=1 Tax=Bacillus sp. ISL-47 TaxID=2819130 RepID=UPI001BE9C1B2|nr:alpha/beta hydrolase [Bacillus sp. ISL-47]MBT2690606.1 alpha/beta hydrolase [Bacillus sp. ISL-47]MBT2711198.1 alpha/beta hydrolase [Pseudomonas sp. ISL-84]
MKERDIQFKTDITLKGTVSLPEKFEGKPPLVVILHGSGPVDRDANVKQMKMNAYKMLAEFFASIGVAVLRYDKRGAGESGGDFYETGMLDLVSDGVAAVKAARELPEIDSDRIFLLGHSEGCSLIPPINKQVNAAGIILLAGQADNVRKASEFQTKQLEEEVTEMKGFIGMLLRALKVHKTTASKQKKLFDEMVESDETVMKKGLTKINAKWAREHFQYEMEEDLAAITCPVLAITGNKDVQVEPNHVHLFAEKVNGPAEGYNVRDMNHLLRDQEEPVSMIKLKSIYKESLTKPLSPEMLSIIKKWAEKYIL